MTDHFSQSSISLVITSKWLVFAITLNSSFLHSNKIDGTKFDSLLFSFSLYFTQHIRHHCPLGPSLLAHKTTDFLESPVVHPTPTVSHHSTVQRQDGQGVVLAREGGVATLDVNTWERESIRLRQHSTIAKRPVFA